MWSVGVRASARGKDPLEMILRGYLGWNRGDSLVSACRSKIVLFFAPGIRSDLPDPLSVAREFFRVS